MDYTQELRRIYEEIPNSDKEIIADFFITFSFFEFGIKECKFTEKDKKYPSPDWPAYVKHIKNNFNPNESKELQEAIAYMTQHPPGKQVFRNNGSMTFDNSYFKNKKNVDLQVIIEMIKTLRNNFFHGGKFKDFMKFEYERNIILFKYSLVILNACLKADDCISEFL